MIKKCDNRRRPRMNTELYQMYRKLKLSDSVLNYCSKIEEKLKEQRESKERTTPTLLWIQATNSFLSRDRRQLWIKSKTSLDVSMTKT